MNGKRNHRTQPQGLVLFFEKKQSTVSFWKEKDATQKETVWLFQIEIRKSPERSPRGRLFPPSPSKTQGHSWCFCQQALSVFSTTQERGQDRSDLNLIETMRPDCSFAASWTGVIHTNWPGAHSKPTMISSEMDIPGRTTHQPAETKVEERRHLWNPKANR